MSANEKFHEYPVLGKITITEANQRQQLINALNDSIDSSDGSVAACFIPRHGLRLTEGTDITDYVICFQCHQIKIHSNGKVDAVLTAGDAALKFNAFLKEAGIPIAQ